MVFPSKESFTLWLETCNIQEDIKVSTKSMMYISRVINGLLKGKIVISEELESLRMEVNVNGIKKVIDIRCQQR